MFTFTQHSYRAILALAVLLWLGAAHLNVVHQLEHITSSHADELPCISCQANEEHTLVNSTQTVSLAKDRTVVESPRLVNRFSLVLIEQQARAPPQV